MNQVKLNKNSWHYKYYSQIVGDDYTPKSLCPYFWSLVGLLMISPIIFFIYYLTVFSEFVSKKIDLILPKKKKAEYTPKTDEEWVVYFKKQSEISRKKNEYWDKFFLKTKFIFKWILLPILLMGIIYSIYFSVEKYGWIPLLIKMGVFLSIILIAFIIITYVDKITENLNNAFTKTWSYINPFKWTVTKIIGGMIFAWYKKSCPLIEWEGGDTQTEKSYS